MSGKAIKLLASGKARDWPLPFLQDPPVLWVQCMRLSIKYEKGPAYQRAAKLSRGMRHDEERSTS